MRGAATSSFWDGTTTGGLRQELICKLAEGNDSLQGLLSPRELPKTSVRGCNSSGRESGLGATFWIIPQGGTARGLWRLCRRKLSNEGACE